MRLALLLTLAATGLLTQCKKNEKFPPLGDKIANPIDVAVDTTEQYFYALNSDYPRDYNQGSISVVDLDGQRIHTIPVPRLGRSLTVAGQTLIVTISNSGETPSQILLFDISTPQLPVLAKTFEPAQCNPVNALAKANYSYWVVSCSNGNIMAGDLTSPLSNSTLNLVRTYPGARRALHIDTSKDLLLAFPTDMGDQTWGDGQLLDSETYSEQDGTKTDVANEIPDIWEKTRAERSNKARRGLYQFAVYDLKEGHNSGWPAKEFKESLADLHWIYFNLANADGTLDMPATADNANRRYYRTNFWDAKSDPASSDVFYLSQRGSSEPQHGGSQHANNVIRVRITGDLKSTTLPTSEVLTFERVYGFKSDSGAGSRPYPGDFELATIQGKQVLVVNHFRDFVSWPGQGYFSLATKVIGENSWFAEISSTSSTKTYYQIALTSSGRAMAANFYGSSLILLDVTPGVGITERAATIQ